MTRTGFNPPEPAPARRRLRGRSRAVGVRRAGPPAPSPLPGLDVLSAGRAAMPPPPSRRIVNKYDESADFSGDPDAEFPLPYLRREAPRRPALPDSPDDPGAPRPRRPRFPGERHPGRARAPWSSAPPTTPTCSPGWTSRSIRPRPGPTRPAKKNKPKIDNALLEKMMKNRNANP